MKLNYLGCSHNKLFFKKRFVYKFFKSNNKYLNEKNFYLNTRKKFNFIPKLYFYNDFRRLLVIENVGEAIKKKEFLDNYDKLKILHDKIINDSGYYHRDLYYKNVLKNDIGKYFIIDFESASKENINIHKRSKEIYIR